MNLIFAGTPTFAIPTLEALHQAGHTIAAVYTQPDRPAGRGRKPAFGPVKEYALAQRLSVYQPETLRDRAPELAMFAPDAMIVVAYGLILPPPILGVPRLGCINVHASLLPRWRGAAPIARSIEAGDTETGITIMQMDAGLDTGPILTEIAIPIAPTDTAAALEARLAHCGAELLVATLARIERGESTPRAQDGARACYAPKLKKTEALIDWSLSAEVLARKVRAYNPRPVANTPWRSAMLRLWEAHPLTDTTSNAAPGTVVAIDDDAIHVQTGNGHLAITRLQAPGGKLLRVREFLNGHGLVIGDRFGT